jgi:hypothetical protein
LIATLVPAQKARLIIETLSTNIYIWGVYFGIWSSSIIEHFVAEAHYVSSYFNFKLYILSYFPTPVMKLSHKNNINHIVTSQPWMLQKSPHSFLKHCFLFTILLLFPVSNLTLVGWKYNVKIYEIKKFLTWNTSNAQATPPKKRKRGPEVYLNGIINLDFFISNDGSCI